MSSPSGLLVSPEKLCIGIRSVNHADVKGNEREINTNTIHNQYDVVFDVTVSSFNTTLSSKRNRSGYPMTTASLEDRASVSFIIKV